MRNSLFLLAAVLCFLMPSPSAGQGGFELGVRYNVLVGDGEPTNDVLSQGLFGRFRLNDRWRMGVAVDHSPEFDIERVAKLVGQTQDPAEEVIDAKASSTFVRAWLERVYPSASGRREWFWTVGAGAGEVKVDDVSGPRAGGGTFSVTTDTGAELVAGAGAGVRWYFAGDWAFEFSLRADQHFADWKLVEQVSGATAQVDDYLLTGGHFGISYRF